MDETFKTFILACGVTFVTETMLHKQTTFNESYIKHLCHMVKQLMLQMFHGGQISRSRRVLARERAPPRPPIPTGLGPPGPPE